MPRRLKDTTICWNCAKACGRCSWSKDFTPVPGWRARPTRVRCNQSFAEDVSEDKKYYDSYEVLECPEFEQLIMKKGEKR